MGGTLDIIQTFNWRDLSATADFDRWADAKRQTDEATGALDPVPAETLAAPSNSAVAELLRRNALQNFAVYSVTDSPPQADRVASDLLRFAAAFGLRGMEDHRSANADGVVALRTSQTLEQRGYIPYTPKPLNWHTDGYYNAAGARVNGFVLHCVRPAMAGGENRIVDPEMAYLHLRAANPDYVAALMHPQAMTIPENREASGAFRPASVGPVFYPDPRTGRLQMRYTARTRSIAWRDDPLTLAAAGCLRGWLSGGDPAIRTVRLGPGQGILNNNVLHNRSAFTDDPERARLILRVRFHTRIAETAHGATE